MCDGANVSNEWSLVNMKGKIYNAYDRTRYVYIANGVMWIILYVSIDKRGWFPLKIGVLQ